MIDILLIINITLMYSAPLILAGLGGVISEKSGVVNLALEGMMTIGAFAAVVFAIVTGNVWLAFLGAGMAGALLAVLHAVATVTFSANQTISGVALNFLGPGLAVFLSRIIFDAVRSTPITVRMPGILSFIPNPNNNIVLSMLNVNATVLLAVILVVCMFIFLYKTKWGLRVMAVGEHPKAADTLGVNVNKTRFLCVVASGMFAGFGGASYTLAIVSIFSPDIISGSGFIALAAVIFGKWTPHGLLGACLLFGLAQALTIFLGGRDLAIPHQFITMMPYVLTIIVLVLFVGKSVAPKAIGEPYEKSK